MLRPTADAGYPRSSGCRRRGRALACPWRLRPRAAKGGFPGCFGIRHNRKKPELVHVELEAKPITGLLADGVGYQYWTYNGTVPGPMIRVRQGDTVELTLKNSTQSPVSHSIDSHGVLGPGGGGKVTQTPPGATSVFQFKAMNPGVYIYHCATPMIPYHLAHGMYGLMVVEPPGGWPKVDREFYVMQGDIYLIFISKETQPKAACMRPLSIRWSRRRPISLFSMAAPDRSPRSVR
jgi:FtsP/CotA-like multicopper oxidase with cupredoxin domain